MSTKIVFLFLFAFIQTLSVSSQTTNDSTLINIETFDGNEFMGQIVHEDSLKIIFKTEKLGDISIFKTDIKRSKTVEVQQIKDGKYWFPNPQSTRYFWSPNGYGLKEGEGYYQNNWVIWNQFAYGLSDNFSIGAGVIPLFLFSVPTPVFATVKFSIPVVDEKFNIAAGAIAGTIIGESETGFGILYGLATLGSPDVNVTFGLGYGFAGGEMASTPAININGLMRVSKSSYIITENYILSGGGESVVLISFGGRTIFKKVALDYGLVLPFFGDGIEIALPWLGFSLPFGKTS